MIFGHLFYEWHRITCSRDFDLVDEKEKKIKSFILKATYDLSNVCEDYTLCNLKYQERLISNNYNIIFLILSYKSFLRYGIKWAIPYFIK